MNERAWLVEQFEQNRGRLRAVAYRMLGSLNEADDAIQEAWLRLSRSDEDNIENLGAWLTTVVSRVCLDMLRSRKSRREEPIGDPLREPVAGSGPGSDPEQVDPEWPARRIETFRVLPKLKKCFLDNVFCCSWVTHAPLHKFVERGRMLPVEVAKRFAVTVAQPVPGCVLVH